MILLDPLRFLSPHVVPAATATEFAISEVWIGFRRVGTASGLAPGSSALGSSKPCLTRFAFENQLVVVGVNYPIRLGIETLTATLRYLPIRVVVVLRAT